MVLRILQQYALPMVATLALHSVIVLAMLSHWGTQPPKNEIKRPNFVQAKLVQLEDVTKQNKKKAEQAKKIVDLTKKRKEEERRKREEKKRIEQQRKKAAEKKRAADAKKKAEAEKKRKELEKKEKQEAEKKRQQALMRKQEQAAFDQALAEEQQRLDEESYAVAAQSYMSAISQRIEQHWSRPPSARNGMQCELKIQLVPTGRVVNVDILKSSGNALFDRSALQAVQKAEQFPVVKKMKPEVFERYYRELTLIFRPQDLRQ